MVIIGVLFSLLGGLCLFLYGMKLMSDGIQQSAGDRLQRALGLITKNRFAGVATGFVITGIIQSSSAVTVMVVSFVNAGLLTLTQSIGVIMGANIGTTVTAWIVSLIGFSLKISELALPAVGIGFIAGIIKWKYRNLGAIVMGFGLLFMGLDFMVKAMPQMGDSFNFIANFSNLGFLSNLIGAGAGFIMTLLLHSSSASTAITLTMAFNGLIGYEMAASMILGANIGTTVDAALSSIGTKTAAKRAALIHVLFNVFGTCWALPLLRPLLALVGFLTPGTITGMAYDPMVPAHLAMLHTVFNTANAIIFLPFVNQFAALVSRIIKDTETSAPLGHYRLQYKSGTLRNTPQFNILRAEKEIRDMAGLTLDMIGRFRGSLDSMQQTPLAEGEAVTLTEEFRKKEEYADEMRESLTAFLMECTRGQLNHRSERRVSRLIRIIADLEDMTDDCYSLSLILERSVRKNQLFKGKEIKALIPYVGLAEEFLRFLSEHMNGVLTDEQTVWAGNMEGKIDKSRNKLRRLGRKRIEAGKDVKTELLFIDMVRRVEKLGDYCYNIAEALSGGYNLPRGPLHLVQPST
jgi:phosphate:Na+ symporter